MAPKITSEYYSQEVRLLSSGSGPLQWIAGLYAFHLSGDANFILSSRADPSQPLLVRTFDPVLKTTSYAGFAEATLEVVPRLFVTGGIRYTHEKRSFDQIVNGVALFSADSGKNPLTGSRIKARSGSKSDRTRISTRPTAPASKAVCST